MRLSTIMRTIVLPAHLSEFEVAYLRRMNRIGLWFFALHLPALALVAVFNDTKPGLAIALTSLVLVGPIAAYRTFTNPRRVSMVYGFTAMMMGALLVHFGQGPTQIEMHFYFFALIAMLALYGNPMVIVIAAGTVAMHHLVLWMVTPSSVFNYDAAVWVVVVHAVFVVLESIAAVFIARSFFDNVIGLEKIVAARTSELDARNREMHLVFENIDQGLVTLDRTATVASEGSAALAQWFGACKSGTPFETYLRAVSPVTADSFAMAFEQLMDGLLPVEVCVELFPSRMSVAKSHYGLRVTPITSSGTIVQLLVVISDITAQVERERLEGDQREMMGILDRVVSDRGGFVEFHEEAEALVSAIVSRRVSDPTTLRRIIHTLKGNSMLFGAQSIADLCHAMETSMDDEAAMPDDIALASLQASWTRLTTKLATVLGDNASKRRVEVDAAAIDALVDKALRDTPRGVLALEISELALEPTATRLRRVAEQATRIASRLGKEPLSIEVRDNGLRFDPGAWQEFWSAFVHVVRNAVDHGIELPHERLEHGKSEHGTLTLETAIEGDQFVIRLSDDGRGIAWDRVRQRALDMSIPAGTQKDLEKALFQDGLSTAEQVTEYSGRGVGMGAVRAACNARGGQINIASSSAGTRLQFTFPAAALNPRCPIERPKAA